MSFPDLVLETLESVTGYMILPAKSCKVESDNLFTAKHHQFGWRNLLLQVSGENAVTRYRLYC